MQNILFKFVDDTKSRGELQGRTTILSDGLGRSNRKLHEVKQGQMQSSAHLVV